MKTTEEPIELTQDETEQVSAGGPGESWFTAVIYAIDAGDEVLAKQLYHQYKDLGWLSEGEIYALKRAFLFVFGHDIEG